MKPEEQTRYDFECFIELLPFIFKILRSKKLSDKVTEYKFNKVSFLIRFNKENDVTEMSLSSEKTIFPTLVFSQPASGEIKLLYFRLNFAEFKNALYQAAESL
jgi:hypothetical protein